MWRNYLTTFARFLSRHKGYAFVNIFALSLGMAASIAILLYVRHELSYDAWLPDSPRVYQLQTTWNPPDEESSLLQKAPFPAAAAFKNQFPQVEQAAAIFDVSLIAKRGAEAVSIENGWIAEPQLFEVLQLAFAHGERAQALSRPNSIVLSANQAVRFFGNENPVGRTLPVVHRGQEYEARVTGVLEPLPPNTHMDFDVVMRLEPAMYEGTLALENWNCCNSYVYLKLREKADAAAVSAQLPAFEKRAIPPEGSGRVLSSPADRYDLSLVNVRDVHFGEAQEDAQTTGNDVETIALFSMIALLILGIAIVNFANLSAARATQRTREVAVRKIVGANRRQLIVQFMTESILLVAVAVLIGLALLEIALPELSDAIGGGLSFPAAADGALPVLIPLLLLVGIAGGLYPALYLSRIRPANALKASAPLIGSAGTTGFRNLLVVAQFAVSIGLILCTTVIYAQLVHLRTTDPGYRHQGLLTVKNLNRMQNSEKMAETFARQVTQLDGVTSATRTNLPPGQPNIWTTDFFVPGRTEPVIAGDYLADSSYIETLQMKLVAGRNFSDENPKDRAIASPWTLGPDVVEAEEREMARRGLNVLVNETAARRFGYRAPPAAVGQTVLADIADTEGVLIPATIVGVVGDANFRSVREPPEAAVYIYQTFGPHSLVVRYEGVDPARIHAEIGQLWKRLATEIPYEAEFTDTLVEELYRSDRARGAVFAVFAFLAVLIACSGLFGLSAFAAERRTREIALRKVFGARIRDVLALFSWQFFKPVLIANLIAWPAAWWLMRDWLNGFGTRVDLNFGWFLAAGLLALLIAQVTIAGHALRVARLRPAETLRYE